MGTRCLVSFIDNRQTVNIYQHSDGYPDGVSGPIAAAVKFAWQLPRFEACDFSAAFVAANKTRGGHIYIYDGGDPIVAAPGDLAYRYEVRCVAETLQITAFKVNADAAEIFKGTLEQFTAWAETAAA